MNNYIIYDFETTGLDILKDRAVEVAALLIENQKVKDSFVTIINCGKKSTTGALKVHGISFKESQEGMEAKKVFEKLSDFMRGHFIVAHNGNNYDHFMLKTEFHRHNIRIPDCKLIDSLSLAQKSNLGLSSLSLESLCKHFKIKNSNAHRALGDSKALVKIFEQLKGKNSLSEMHKICRQKNLIDIFPHFEGFDLLLNAIEGGKNLEIEYQNQKGEIKRRWIKPDSTVLNFGSMCPMINAKCNTDKIEKAFRLDGFRGVFSLK